MADFNKVKQDIKDDIRPNGVGEITGQTMQDILIDIVEIGEAANNELSQQITATNNRVASAEKKISENKAAADKKFTETAEQIAEINNEVEKKADTDKRYPSLTAGFADNLVGRGEATPEEFTYRASAGMGRSITDDTARVKKIKGNSVVWNQQCNRKFIINHNNHTESSESIHIGGIDNYVKTLMGHKVYFFAKSTNKTLSFYINIFQSYDISKGCIISYTNPSNYSVGLYARIPALTNVENLDVELLIVDLTKMFGAGNEPTTVDDFYARIPSGIDTTAYNEGEIINLNTEAIKTVGFNQWDEQWELGGIDTVDGRAYEASTIIRSKNFNKCVGGQTYFCKGAYSIFWYDINKLFIGVSHVASREESAPLNASYFKLGFYVSYGITYNHDICINLSHTGIENGKYKPYTPFTRELPIIQKYFPNGMRSAGTAFDSIEWDSSKQKWVAVQRIGEVDLGDLNWVLEGNSYTIQASEIGAAIPHQANLPNIVTTAPMKAISVNNATAVVNSLEAHINPTNRKLQWFANRDLYPNVASLKSAMQGVMLNYELAEPIVTEIEENINFDYYVEDFGTEEALSSVSSAPFRADVVYTFNAVDTIRNNYLEIEELKKQMVQMQNAVSAMQTAQVTNEEV